jgi:DNA-binding CsgD family transcriptional regulator
MTERRRIVLVASGDRLFAESVAGYLGAHQGWDAATAADGVLALGAIGRVRPEAVLVLGELPRLDAATLARQVHLRWGAIRVVTVGSEPGPEAEPLPAAADVEDVVAALGGAGVPTEEVPRDDRTRDVALLRTLTKRELVILRLLAQGHASHDVAERLRISPNTVRTHTQNLYSKLGCHSRLELVRIAARHGLLEAVGEPSPQGRTGGRDRRARRGTR